MTSDKQTDAVTPMTAETLADLFRSRTEFVTRYQDAHPEIDLTDALTAAFSAGVTTALNTLAK